MTPLLYLERTPAPPLRRFVRCIWLLETPPGSPPPPADRVLPDGCVEVVFHYRSAFERRAAGDTTATTQHRHAVVGQIETALDLRATGDVGIVGVRFEPAGARPILGVALRELTGRSVALEDLWGRGAACLIDAVHAEPAPADGRAGVEDVAAARLVAVERALAGFARRAGAPRSVAEEATHAILAADGARSVAALAADLAVAGRTLERRFVEEVGISPKTLARIVRFQSALRRMRDAQSASLAAVAAACGYADQSHFSREFAEFAGESPAAWRRGQHDLAAAFVAP